MARVCIKGSALHDSLVSFGLTGEQKRSKVVSFIRDGCSTNTAALRMIQPLFHKSCDIKCVSHASSNIGKVLYDSCNLAVKFIGNFNNMLNTSNLARLKFKVLIQTGIKRFTGDIRWYYLQECATQIFKFWPQVLLLINDEDEFTPSIRNKMKLLLEDHLNTIRLELSLFQDVAIPLAKLCYKQEGDAFLIPTTYDHWHTVLDMLNDLVDGRKPLVNVNTTANELFPGDILNRNEAISNTKLKIIDCLQKMMDTTTQQDKLYFTLNIFRACRLLNYKFIAKTPLDALVQLPTHPNEMIRGEIIYLYSFPFIDRSQNDKFLKPFIDELPTYQSLCEKYVNEEKEEEEDNNAEEEEQKEKNEADRFLLFWKQNVLTIPKFAELAKRILSCTPSSATVERLFSLLSSFNDNQSSALADYAKGRTMIRYNQNFRNKYK